MPQAVLSAGFESHVRCSRACHGLGRIGSGLGKQSSIGHTPAWLWLSSRSGWLVLGAGLLQLALEAPSGDGSTDGDKVPLPLSSSYLEIATVPNFTMFLMC